MRITRRSRRCGKRISKAINKAAATVQRRRRTSAREVACTEPGG